MCLVTGGYTRVCKYNAGGLSNIRYGNRADLITVTKDADGMVTAITMASTTQMWSIEFDIDQPAGFSDNLQVNANKYLLQQLTFTIAGSDQDVKNFLDKLNLAKMFALVQDRGNDVWHLLGENSGGLTAQQSNFGTGNALAELNGAAIILQGVATVAAPTVDPSIVDALLSPAA